MDPSHDPFAAKEMLLRGFAAFGHSSRYQLRKAVVTLNKLKSIADGSGRVISHSPERLATLYLMGSSLALHNPALASHTVPSGDEFPKEGLHLCSSGEVVPRAKVKYCNDDAAVWELTVLLEVSAINPLGPGSE